MGSTSTNRDGGGLLQAFPNNPIYFRGLGQTNYITDAWVHSANGTLYLLASDGLYKVPRWNMSVILDHHPASIPHRSAASRRSLIYQFFDKDYLVFYDDSHLYKTRASSFSESYSMDLTGEWQEDDPCRIQNLAVDPDRELAFAISASSGKFLVIDLDRMQVTLHSCLKYP